jgi:hypothetical protein
VVNLLRLDKKNHERARDREPANEIEKPDDPNILPQPARQNSCCKVTCMIESFIAAYTGGQQPVANDAKAQCGQARGDDGGRCAEGNLRGKDCWQFRGKRNQKAAGSHEQAGYRDEQALHANRIDKQSRRNLADGCRDATGGHDKADVARAPMLRTFEVHRQERAKTIPHIGHQEVEPIQTAQAP